MGVLSRLFGSLGDRLAQRHTKECKLLKSTLKPFARSFFTQVSKRWFFSLRSGGNHCWKPLYFWQFSFLLCANEVDVFVFSHNINWLNRSYEAQLMRRFYVITRVKMVETFYDLCQSSMFTTTFTAKPGLSFFFPLGNLSLDPGGKKTRIVRVLLR